MMNTSFTNGTESSAKVHEYMAASMTCVCLSVIFAAFGIIGNVLTIFVFIKPNAHTCVSVLGSINILLAGQALMDIVFLIFATPITVINGIYFYKPINSKILLYKTILLYVYPIAMAAQTATVWASVVITCERFLAVCRPFKALTACTAGKAKKMLLWIALISMAYNFCRFWELKRTSNAKIRPLLRSFRLYTELYCHWMYFFLMYFIPLVVLVVLNIFIIRTIFHAKRKRRYTSRKGKHQKTQPNREHQTSIMMFVHTCTFILCNSFAFILNAFEVTCYYSVLSTFCITKERYYAFLCDLNNTLVEINSSVPFVIYAIFSRCFRHRLRRMFNSFRIDVLEIKLRPMK